MNDLPGFMGRHRVNTAFFVPSMLAQLLQPDAVPDLETILVGGESLSREIVDTWASKVAMVDLYDPVETSIICAVGLICKETWPTGQIGPVTGGRGWITAPSNPSRIAMVGAVGELLIEGPIVSRGYLDDPGKTAESYLATPAWLAQFRGSRGQKPGRLYRTGDLVSYMPDGSIRFEGRKGTQVKLRGQRVELAEVEHHLRLCFPEAKEVIAEAVVRGHSAEAGALSLMAFINFPRTDTGGDQRVFLASDANFLEKVSIATERLIASVPVYNMTMYLPSPQASGTSATLIANPERQWLRSAGAYIG